MAWPLETVRVLKRQHHTCTCVAGTLAGELAAQPSLAYINFANNQLSGDLEAFGKALMPDSPVGAVFDVSNNALTGGLPEGLGNLAALSTAPAAFPSWNPCVLRLLCRQLRCDCAPVVLTWTRVHHVQPTHSALSHPRRHACPMLLLPQAGHYWLPGQGVQRC